MLRIRRLTQLLLALCACAFISALMSLGLYRLFAVKAVNQISPEMLAEISNIQDINVIKSFFLPFVTLATELRDSADRLAGWGLSFVIIWASLIGFVAIALYRQIISTQQVEINPQSENTIDRAFAGKVELWKIFWGVYVILLLVMQVIASKLFAAFSELISMHGLASLILIPIGLAIPITLHLLAALLVWKSATNTSHRFWTYLARTVVVAITVLPSIKGIYIVQLLLA
ncbi:hypothetical protein GCM10011282_13760 [Undibacterium macrobrachii]|uniref:Yip1 domain-containing protein n=2 Tax=Undibacterium macrobrachii TaxID=1119058 RepID=A0ABQ2XB70_9BURK|nr:hypothetical protein GCM10011282_13760 [Undibacterium macrobrachii]